MERSEIASRVDALEEAVRARLADDQPSDDASQVKKQLKAVDRTVKQLERQAVPVPREMEDLRESLLRQLARLDGQSSELDTAYERLLELSASLAEATRRNLRKDVAALVRKRRPKLIDSAEVQKATLTALEQLGGSARADVIERKVEELLAGALTEFDRDDNNNKHQPRWHSRMYRARNQLLHDGRLSIGRGKNPLWKLSP